MKQFKWILGLALVGLLAVACSSPAPEAPAADAVAEEAAAEVEEEAMEDEAMEEEAMEDDHSDEDHSDEDHSDEDHSDDMADEDMEEEAMEEEAMEEEAMEDEAMEDDMMAGEMTYVVSAADSTVTWTGAKAIGDSHTGTVDISEGSLVVEDGALVSGSFMLDMTTIANSDLSGGMKDRLEGHLMSEDFFAVDEFPAASVEIVSAEANGDGTYNVVADLTIKGITGPVEFVATATEEGESLTATADIIFDRAVYNVQYGSGSFFDGLGDDLINDEVEIAVELVASN